MRSVIAMMDDDGEEDQTAADSEPHKGKQEENQTTPPLKNNNGTVEMTGLAVKNDRQTADDPTMTSESTSLLLRHAPRYPEGASSTYRNFIVFSILFSAVPSAALACLALATARLGSVGAWQTGLLYLTYTLTALTASTAIVQRLGSRNAVILGQALYGSYVACFWIATALDTHQKVLALVGAALGGAGSAILWTAHGAYFTLASEEYALYSGVEWSAATSLFSGIFAFCLLLEETALDLLSTLLVRTWNVPWSVVFCIYAVIAVGATLLMPLLVQSYPQTTNNDNDNNVLWTKATATLRLLYRDPKMKYMIGFNAAFGFAGAFLNSFVSGEIVPTKDESFVGLLVALHGGSAALSSLLFGQFDRKGPVLILGAAAFGGVAVPFLLQPSIPQWTWTMLVTVYLLEGVGRATFESTFKGLFSDYFAFEKEAAFANIILQNGLASVVAYVLSVRLPCHGASSYCVQYRDGSFHNVGLFATLVVATSVVAIVGYWRASFIHKSGADGPLVEYRRRSVASYRSSRASTVSRMDRRTYEALQIAVAEEEEREARIEALPEVS